ARPNGNAPIPITPSRLRSSFHPYNRPTPGRTPAQKEKEDKPLTAEEELEQIRQRQRQRAIQQEEDLYRERKLARMLGKRIKEVDPKDLIGNQGIGSDTDEEVVEEEAPRSPKRKFSTPAAVPATPPQPNRVRKERRGYGLFDSESEDETPQPPKKKQNTSTDGPSADNDKEDALFADSLGPPPPAPQPAHAQLPKSSAQKPA